MKHGSFLLLLVILTVFVSFGFWGCRTVKPAEAVLPGNDAVLQENDLLRNRLGGLEELINQQKEALAEKESELEAAANRIDALTRTGEELSAELKSRGELEERLAGIIEERDRIQAELNELKVERDNLQKTITDEAARLAGVKETLLAQLQEEIESGNLELLTYEGVVIINIRNAVLFQPDSPVITREYEAVLRVLAESFKKVPEKIIRVEGHTAVAARSRYESAWVLGAERAVNVVRFFQEKCTIDPSRLVALSFGEYRPIASNADEAGRIRNRRVQIVLIDRPLYQIYEFKHLQ